MSKQNRLVWVDLEMTGLNPSENVIIEIATLVTDNQLNEVAVGPSLAIYQPQSELMKMDTWNQHQHTKSGLIARVKQSKISTINAEQQTLDFLKKYLQPGESPMCGNSICMDRRFLAVHMQNLEHFFHYRNLDVSTVKILSNLWAPRIGTAHVKKNDHVALSDIRDSIAELQYYRQHFIAK